MHVLSRFAMGTSALLVSRRVGGKRQWHGDGGDGERRVLSAAQSCGSEGLIDHAEI